MNEVDDSPCRACGTEVRLEQREDRRMAGSRMVIVRVCPNPACRMNGPRSKQRLGDKV